MDRSVRLSIIIPTLGRETLTDTLDSVIPQMTKEDELIVIADTSGEWRWAYGRVWATQRYRHVPTAFFPCPPNKEGNGYAQRTRGMYYAASGHTNRTTHIAFMDDDDLYVDGALETIREHADMGVPTIFKMMYGSDTHASRVGDCLWKTKEIVYGNVGTPMCVVPNRWENLGTWKACFEYDGKKCGGDFTFISETVEKFGGVKWVDRVVALIRPMGRPLEGNHSTSST